MDANCYVEPAQKTVAADENQNLAIINLTVWGMGCPNCAVRVRNGLLALKGVVKANVDHATGSAIVEVNSKMVAPKDLINAIFQAGQTSHHEYSAMLL